MTIVPAAAILILLLIGPLAVHYIERNIEAYCLLIGLVAVTLAGAWSEHLIRQALTEPLEISIAVIVAGVIFDLTRHRFDHAFARMRSRMPRPILTMVSIFLIAALASLITAIVAALVLVETVSLLRLNSEERPRVAIAGCFAVGLGASLTPIGEPLSTLAARALNLDFFGLFFLLAPYVVPGLLIAVLLAGYLARGDYEAYSETIRVGRTKGEIVVQAIKVFGFITGLVLISEAYAPLAVMFINKISNDVLFWVNIVSAALDNATLVALEVHNMEAHRAREAIMALLISGGMLIPGNIPNIVSAGAMEIRSTTWAKVGVPVGLVMLTGYFVAFKLVG
jgi:predicted cation transporter